MKEIIKRVLQRLLGYENYLKIFARFKIKTLKHDKREGDFFHFVKLVPDQGVILDIGANLGIMTWHLLHHFKKAKIWAFEPMPDNLEVLKSLMGDSFGDRLKIYNLALGDRTGSVDMVLPEINDVKMQGLSHVVHDSIPEFNDGERFEVKVVRLDDVIPDNVNVTGIKLDVENFEYFVLKGGANLIQRCRPVIYTELWENDNRMNCISFIRELGYEVKVHTGNELKDFSPSTYSGQNFFFLPKEEHSEPS